ncbi:N-acetylmuramoyl-L-alanine amidase [Clostridium botulinum]|uniref:N-acetylmuramoyl-L-alanine amidase n=2 Tax=Clostridium botulinum TaxID=1491 RepID=C1FPX2_CLOBJ|nr:N-acetylmuramoyl-L-alanine amidase [Clostridium botulinum]ACO84930.1 N-acetylmuramoyl-L-alanine amidase [Clostridium botulinum A2 str. Kyoto]AUN07218.1 N-acetylmuramoyl-L-alanine amidase [Clostridium botulinum]MBN3364517.1 N-acetylmuramoyl-L-alanine amidase [Clostridium botulinum]MBN3376089.1 N-acetylmuramoyl-L-alanine amidase [Clostridium botulinum]MBN3385273.1 N-acetylmuramoyl-L-alanine amidase [Clostridium botulinum]
MARLCFDYGHGGEDSGACYKGRKESNDVLSLGKAVAAEVRRYGVTVDETRIKDITVSLMQRSNFENRNNYNYFISFHRNAFKPEKARGAETYIYLSASTKAKALAEKIQVGLVSIGFVNRGVKTANYHVLRETRCPAVLIEIGFIDSTNDNNLFDGKRNEIIIEIAKAILSQLGISYKENKSNEAIAQQKQQATSGQTLYRVMAGSYTVRENAENQVQRLKVSGFDATIMVCNR